MCTEVFQRFFCSPSVSSVISVRSENAVGGTMSFAQRYRGHRGSLKLWLLPSQCPLRSPREAELCTEVFQRFDRSPSLSFVNSVRSENGMGGMKSFARRHGGHRGVSRIWLLLSVSFVISVRAENGMGGSRFRVQGSGFKVQRSEF